MIAAGWVSGVCGLSSAAAWGAGDFFGGLATKRSGVYAVVIGSQLFGVAALIAAALILGDGMPTVANLGWAAAAGLSGAVGLLALYRALAIGRMGLAAPVSGVLSAAIPVIIAARLKEFPVGSSSQDSRRRSPASGSSRAATRRRRAFGISGCRRSLAADSSHLSSSSRASSAHGSPRRGGRVLVALSGVNLLLARVVLQERVTAVQLAGLCAILSAIVMITLR